MKPLYIILLILSLFSCIENNTEKNVRSTQKSTIYAPDNSFYEQRAYPFDSINYTVFNKELKKVQQQSEQAVASRGLSTSDWKLVGPTNVGGRVTDICLNPNDPNIFFVATAVGGIFKTTDKGKSWKAVFDKSGRLSIGDIAIAPSNTKILYAGTGEANASATSGAFFGDGIYKSINGGKSWENVGLKNSHHIGRIVVNPNNENHVLVAAMGNLYSKNEERGLYQTKNGGESWEQLLFVNDSTACVDVVMHPLDSNIIYAVSWERLRRPWGRSYAGPSSCVYRSKDGGKNWEALKNGLPIITDRGRMGLAIAPSDPNTLYLSVTKNAISNGFDGLYKSIDGGDSWQRTNDFFLGGMYSNFGWYFGNVRVDPEDADIAYVLGVSLFQTTNGGNAWSRIARDVHVDHHALETHPKNPNMLVLGNDGGVYLSEDKGTTWTHLKGLPITQFYQCEVAQSIKNRYYGGTQDNGTIMSPDGKEDNWSEILGGDGFHVIVDPEMPDIMYAEYQWGNLFRSVNGGASFQWALRGIQSSDRNNWNTPIAIDPINTSTLYYGTNRLYRSTDRAATWSLISEDLTKGQHSSGTTSYGTISTIAVAPTDPNIIYAGTDDGNVQVTFDGGNNWQLVSAELPNRYVTGITCDLKEPLTAYVTFSGYRSSDYLSHIFMTEDGGATWQDISGNLPEIPINDVVIDEKNPDVLYIATDMGVWRQKNRMSTWSLLGTKLPNTVVTDLVLHKNNRQLIAATFGRSMYSYDLDFLTPDQPRLDTIIQPLAVFPNPIKDFFELQFDTESQQKGNISIRDIEGKIVMQRSNLLFNEGKNQISLEANMLPRSGDYILSVETKDVVKSILVKVVK